MPNNSRIAPFAAAAALVLFGPVATVSTAAPSPADPPRYSMQPIAPAGDVSSSQAAAQSRIFAFDSLGRGYGYAAAAGGGLMAVRWENGSLIPLPTPAGGQARTVSYASGADSDGGHAIGWYRGGPEFSAGVMWRGGEMVSLGHMLPLAVNPAGVVAGVVQNPESPRWHAPAVWHNGELSTLPMAPEAMHAWIAGVSDGGVVAGSWYAPGGRGTQAVQWIDGRPQVLPAPAGAVSTEARGMNAAGWIVGSTGFGDGTRATMWRDGEAVDLGVLDAANHMSWAESINAHGQVVGVGQTATGWTAFLWQDGAMHDLRELVHGLSPSEEFNAAYLVIGDAGQIAGVQFMGDGTGRGFVLSPMIPAPGAAVVLLLAACALTSRQRQRAVSSR